MTGTPAVPTRRRWPIVLLVTLVVAGAAWWAVGRARPHVFNGTLIQSPEAAPDFELTSDTGPVRLSDFRGEVVAVFFGYTFCPDVCPTTMADLAKTSRLLGEDAGRVQVLMVSVDPERDTPDLVSRYARQFDPSFVGVTGTPEQVAEAATVFGIYYQKREQEGTAGYLVDHTANVLVIDRDGRLRLVFPYGAGAEAIAEDLEYLLDS